MSIISEIRRLIQSTSEIIPNVYQLTIRGTNVILIVEEKLTLIDTGLRGSSPQIIGFIHHLGRSPEEISLIILTHKHVDHMGGLAELKQLTSAKVAMHKADISDIENQPSRSGARQKPPLTTLSSPLRSVFSVKSRDADIQLAGGEVLQPLGGLEVVHTPGHTPGSISLFSQRNKLLIVGDALRKRRKTLYLPPKMVSSDLSQAIESVKRMAQLDFNILCFGHGLPLSDGVYAKVQDLIERNKD
jgi:glyoxylase-like metal-dependent hydrolase (beta-lactamase superfamily II)